MSWDVDWDLVIKLYISGCLVIGGLGGALHLSRDFDKDRSPLWFSAPCPIFLIGCVVSFYHRNWHQLNEVGWLHFIFLALFGVQVWSIWDGVRLHRRWKQLKAREQKLLRIRPSSDDRPHGRP